MLAIEIYFLSIFSLGRQVCDYASSPEPSPSRCGTIPGPGTGDGLSPWLGVKGGQGSSGSGRQAGRAGAHTTAGCGRHREGTSEPVVRRPLQTEHSWEREPSQAGDRPTAPRGAGDARAGRWLCLGCPETQSWGAIVAMFTYVITTSVSFIMCSALTGRDTLSRSLVVMKTSDEVPSVYVIHGHKDAIST